MCAGWRIKDTADVSKPGTGHAREFKKGRRGIRSVLRLAGFRERVEELRQLYELGNS